MNRLFLVSALSLVLLVHLSGCSPARTGLAGPTLTTNTRPAISITANPPLEPAAGGLLWVSLPNNRDLLSSVSASFNYAVFGEPGGSGLVTRHAHAILARLSDSQLWTFEPDTWKDPNAFTHATGPGPEGYAWTTQLMRVPSRGDWFSDLWLANGRKTPQVWLAKRWASLLDGANKAVLEYREPWPDCLEFTAPDMLLITGDSAACLGGFNSRAAKAFTVSRQNTPLGGPAPAPLLTAMPRGMPDTGKLVGRATETGVGDSNGDHR